MSDTPSEYQPVINLFRTISNKALAMTVVNMITDARSAKMRSKWRDDEDLAPLVTVGRLRAMSIREIIDDPIVVPALVAIGMSVGARLCTQKLGLDFDNDVGYIVALVPEFVHRDEHIWAMVREELRAHLVSQN